MISTLPSTASVASSYNLRRSRISSGFYVAKQENQATRTSLRLKGKALFRVKTARLSPRKGTVALPKKEFYSLGFYGVLWLDGRASQKKELSQAKETAVSKIYRVVRGSGVRRLWSFCSAETRRQQASEKCRTFSFHFPNWNPHRPSILLS